MKETIAHIYHTVARWLQGTPVADSEYVSRLYRRLAREMEPCWIRYDGAYLYVDPQDMIGGTLYVNGEFDTENRRVIKQTLSGGDIAIDAGAHVGHHTVSMRNCVGEHGRVISFEPHPKNSKYIRKSIKRNEWTNVEVVQKALSDKKSQEILLENPGNTGGSTLQSRELEQFPEIRSNNPSRYQVKTTTLTRELSARGIDSVSLLKIDVEGGEYEIIRDIKDHLDIIDRILFEIHTKKMTAEETEELLGTLLGYGSLDIPFDDTSFNDTPVHELDHGTTLLWCAE